MDTKKLSEMVEEIKKEAHRVGLYVNKATIAELMSMLDSGDMARLGKISISLVALGKYLQGITAERIAELPKESAIDAVWRWNSGVDDACVECRCDACESERAAARKAMH